MALKFRWIIIPEDGTVVGTNDPEVISFAGSDGSSIILDLETFTSAFDGDVEPIARADPGDFSDPPDSELPEDDEGDDE